MVDEILHMPSIEEAEEWNDKNESKLLVFIFFIYKILKRGTSRQSSGKGAISKRFPPQKPDVGRNQTNNQVPIP